MIRTPYINRKAVKDLALRSLELRNGKHKRVSAQFLEEVNARVAEHVAYKVQTWTGTGKTL